MRTITRLASILAFLALSWPAQAQVFPNIPANTVLGRLGAGQAGPPQPIPLPSFMNAVAPFLSGLVSDPNVVDNGDFQWAQRGSTWTNVTSAIKVADRWWGNAQATTNNSFTQTAVIGTENSYGSGHALIIQRTAAETRNTTYALYQALSTEESQPYAGQQVTLTVWARVGNTYSGGPLLIQIISGTGTDQSGSILGTWTGQTTVAFKNCTEATVTSACSITATLPAGETQLAVYMSWTSTGVAGGDDKVVIYGVDLRPGVMAPTYVQRLPPALSWSRVAYFFERLNPGMFEFFAGSQQVGIVTSAIQMNGSHSGGGRLDFATKRIGNYSDSVKSALPYIIRTDAGQLTDHSVSTGSWLATGCNHHLLNSDGTPLYNFRVSYQWVHLQPRSAWLGFVWDDAAAGAACPTGGGPAGTAGTVSIWAAGYPGFVDIDADL
jgi:hypothetical protein